MEKVLKAKTRSYDLIELRMTGSSYVIYVSGQIKLSTSDLIYAISEFDKY